MQISNQDCPHRCRSAGACCHERFSRGRPQTTRATAGTSKGRWITSPSSGCTFTLTAGSGVRRSITSGVSTKATATGTVAFGSASKVDAGKKAAPSGAGFLRRAFTDASLG